MKVLNARPIPLFFAAHPPRGPLPAWADAEVAQRLPECVNLVTAARCVASEAFWRRVVAWQARSRAGVAAGAAAGGAAAVVAAERKAAAVGWRAVALQRALEDALHAFGLPEDEEYDAQFCRCGCSSARPTQGLRRGVAVALRHARAAASTSAKGHSLRAAHARALPGHPQASHDERRSALGSALPARTRRVTSRRRGAAHARARRGAVTPRRLATTRRECSAGASFIARTFELRRARFRVQ